MNIDGRIAQANGRLKSSGVRLQIEQYGQKLVLRGTLPPKQDSKKTRPYQQRITTGLPTNADGVKQAEAKAREISALLVSNRFAWSDFQRTPNPTLVLQTCGEWVEALHNDYVQRGGNPETWAVDYWVILKRLPQEKNLTPELLKSVVLDVEPNTRQRLRASTATRAIAQFAQIDFDPTPFAGNYSIKNTKKVEIAEDDVIAQWFFKIDCPNWQWVYGMLATYGLRPHEVFRVNFEQLSTGNSVVEVFPNTKTGRRFVYPYYPEWFKQFDLQTVRLPNVDLQRTNSKLGKSVYRGLRATSGVSFHPYVLRHSWAVRTLTFDLPYAEAARQMGHSIKMHEQVYWRWITPKHQRTINEAALSSPNRPRAPDFSHD